jgi:hypothetical protein
MTDTKKPDADKAAPSSSEQTPPPPKRRLTAAELEAKGFKVDTTPGWGFTMTIAWPLPKKEG